MEISNAIWFASVLGVLVGVLVGTVLTLWLAPSNQKNRGLKKHLADKQDELKEYQLEVTAHFTRTSELLSELAQSYKDVHNHLAEGAQNLCKPGFDGKPILPKLTGLAEEQIDALPHEARPPLDYAPRSTPYDRGTLNEEYGLEKFARDDDTTVITPTPDAPVSSKASENV